MLYYLKGMIQRFGRKKIVVFSFIFLMALISFASIKYFGSEATYAVKSDTIKGFGENGGSAKVAIKEGNTRRAVTSPIIETKFEFNAVAPYWKESIPENTSREFSIRISDNGKDWGSWIRLNTEGAIRDDEPRPGYTYVESPIFTEGRFVQYRVELRKEGVSVTTPTVSDINLAYIDSREPRSAQVAKKFKTVASTLFNTKASAATQSPRIISRAEWGSPDPYGEALKGQGNYWPPEHAPVKQVFLHHTVNSNYNSDPAAVVRGIWHFHTYTRGWGDIGYNYLVDHNGNIYEGRYGGDNVVGGHVYEYNTASMGVAMIGCYDSGDPTCRNLNGGSVSGPSSRMWGGLTNLLAWKFTNYLIDPFGTHTFCKYNGSGCLNLSTIAGHRDANLTTCPGNILYDGLNNVRIETYNKKRSYSWNYSAKQTSFGRLNFSGANDTLAATVQFVNNGSSTWSNSSNRFMMKVTAPDGRISQFRDSSTWIGYHVPAVLSEQSVAPGQVGSFNFTLKRPPSAYGSYQEYYTLAVEGVEDLKQYFTLHVDVYCTIGQASNPRANGALIKNAADHSVYLIEGGKKRYIGSHLAAASNGYDFKYITPVSTSEISSIDSGSALDVREGTVIKSPNSPNVYIIDKVSANYQRRWVTSSEAMFAHGIRGQEIQNVSQGTVDGYASGPDLGIQSALPNGRVVKADNDPNVYLIEDGQKRWITAPSILASYGITGSMIATVPQEKINSVAQGSDYENLRAGTVVKEIGTPNLYLTDELNNIPYKRYITSPVAYMNSGFIAKPIIEVPKSTLDSYSVTDDVVCHK
jgi:hypothetical protein